MHVTLARLFRLWLSIGAQSFGGGAATSYLIQQTFVDRLRRSNRWSMPS
jgi:chromate transport protein ChrA